MPFRTKPRGMHAHFESDCWQCGGTITVTNGRVDRHECPPRTDDKPITLADLRAALDNR